MGRHNRKRRRAANEAPTTSGSAARRSADNSYRNTRLFILIFAIVALVAVVGTALAVFIVDAFRNERADYLKDNLSKYIYISEDDYKSFDVRLKRDPIDDLAIDEALIQLLYMYRTPDEVYGEDGQLLIDLPKNDDNEYVRTLMPGDSVNLRYRGYTLGKDGAKHDIDTLCDFASAKPSSVEIGKGEMYTGFEFGLVGKTPGAYSKLKNVTGERQIKSGDLIKITYSVIYHADTEREDEQDVTVIVNTDSRVCDEMFGEGFGEFIKGKSSGTVEESFVVKNKDGRYDRSYVNMNVASVWEVGDNPLTISVRLPADYPDAELAGDTVYYDVYVETMQLYNVPEINEELVTKKLGLTMDELNKYDGDGVEKKLRSYLAKKSEEAYQAQLPDIVKEYMWEHFLKCAEVKRLPEGDVLEYYNDYEREMINGYNGNSDTYGNLDSYALTQLNLSAGDDWRAYLREQAENRIIEKLAFYYVLRRENFLPSDEEYEELYDYAVEQQLIRFLELAKCKRENYASDEEYNEAVDRYTKLMHKTYDEEYFREAVIYTYALEKITEFANIIYE